MEESYPRTGSRACIVLCHGLTSSLSLNDRLLFPDWKQLRDHYPLVRFDARGHGQSSPCHDSFGYTWENLGQDLVALIERLELEDIVIGGSSMGAATSLYCLLEASVLTSKVRGLVLVMPPTFGEAREQIAKVYQKFASILEEKDQTGLKDGG